MKSKTAGAPDCGPRKSEVPSHPRSLGGDGKVDAGAAMLRRQQVLALTTWSNSTLYNRMRDGFPRGVRMGPRRVAWPAADVYAYIARQVGLRDQHAAAATKDSQ